MRILFCNPERDLLLTYSRLLEAEGFEVSTAFDGPQLSAALAGGPAFVILDSALPRMDAAAMLRYLAEQQNGVLLLVNDRKTLSPYRELLSEDAFLFYPFSPQELLGRVRTLLAGQEHEGERS